MSRILRFLCLIVLVIGLLAQRSSSLDCPPCFYNQKNPNVQGHGLQDGRPIVTVQISTSGTDSWNVDNSGNAQSTTNAAIWNGVQGCSGCVPPDGALGMWNAARGTANAPPPYYFKIDQNTTTPNITIIRDSNLPPGACGMLTGPNGGPYTLHLPPSASGQDIWALVETVAHELGHSIGLFEANDPECYSIMQRAAAGCAGNGNSVSEREVNQSVRAMNPGAQTGCETNVEPYLHQCDEMIANNCSANGGSWDSDTCTCINPSGCDQSRATDCYNAGGTWNTEACGCDFPYYHYGDGGDAGGSPGYCEYNCTDYFTCTSLDGEHWDCKYQTTDCEQVGCY